MSPQNLPNFPYIRQLYDESLVSLSKPTTTTYQQKKLKERNQRERINMGRLKGIVLVALLVCYAMQVVVSQSYGERRRERGLSPEEEERRAREEDWRRREKTAEEERRHRQERESWEEEEEERGRPSRRRWEEEEEEEEERRRRPQPEPYGPRPEPYEPGRRGKGEMFLLKESKKVISTEAGEMRVVKGYGGRLVERPLHIGFLTLEPRSLFVPQYLDSSLILFVRRGILYCFSMSY